MALRVLRALRALRVLRQNPITPINPIAPIKKKVESHSTLHHELSCRENYFAVQGAACLHSLALGHSFTFGQSAACLHSLALGHSFTFGQSAAFGQVAHSTGQGFSVFWHSAAFGHDAQSAAGQAVSAAGCTHSVQAFSVQTFFLAGPQHETIATATRAIIANVIIFFIIVIF